MVTFNPGNQSVFAVDKYRCFKGTAPSLGVLCQAYGEDIADSWIECQIRDLSEYAGCKEKLSIEQIEEVARVIRVEWGYLKVTELMFFLHKFKAGTYGRFYGAVDGLVITSALQEFIADRNEYLFKLRQEEEKISKAKEDAKHDAEVAKFRAHCSAAGMLPLEYIRFIKKHNITMEEMDEIGWLFKLGYEREDTNRTDNENNGIIGKVIGGVRKIFHK